MKQTATTPEAPDAPFLSQAIISNGTIYVSGQIHSKPDGSIVEGSVNEVYPTYFAESLPVREAVCVQTLPLGATIEISVVAANEH